MVSHLIQIDQSIGLTAQPLETCVWLVQFQQLRKTCHTCDICDILMVILQLGVSESSLTETNNYARR